MGDMSREPSMEEILSSIRRVIARDDRANGGNPLDDDQSDDGAAGAGPTATGPVGDDTAKADPGKADTGKADPGRNDDVLELTSASATVEPAAPDALLSRISEQASRQSLAALTSALEGGGSEPAAAPQGGDMTINAMVEAMLRPMLRQWLDTNLPPMVERLVSREIARITGNRL